MLAIMLACAPHSVVLDNQNWLSGDLVDQYDPKVAGMHIAASTSTFDDGPVPGEEWRLLEVDYLDADDYPLVIVTAQWRQTEYGTVAINTLNCADAAAVFDPDRYGSQGCDSITVTLGVDDDIMRGSFAVWNGTRLAGAFSGPIAWDDWY